MRRQMERRLKACRYRSLAPFCQGLQIRFTSIYLSSNDRTIVMAHSWRGIPRSGIIWKRAVALYRRHERCQPYIPFSTLGRKGHWSKNFVE